MDIIQYKDDKFVLQKIIIFYLLLLSTYLYISSLIIFFVLGVRKHMNSILKAKLDS